mmetsp:Transcript_72813/g.115697  ORF Transcript_72813/g.115697 Transcript_72813/m.115697 type:complete len:299 (-) Transcript_72813:2325-3221(-)
MHHINQKRASLSQLLRRVEGARRDVDVTAHPVPIVQPNTEFTSFSGTICNWNSHKAICCVAWPRPWRGGLKCSCSCSTAHLRCHLNMAEARATARLGRLCPLWDSLWQLLWLWRFHWIRWIRWILSKGRNLLLFTLSNVVGVVRCAAWQWAQGLVFHGARFIPQSILSKVEFQWNCFLILILHHRLCYHDFANRWTSGSRHPLIHNSFILPASQHPHLLSLRPSFCLIAAANIIHINRHKLDLAIPWQSNRIYLSSLPSWHAGLLRCRLLSLVHPLHCWRWCFKLRRSLFEAVQVRHT